MMNRILKINKLRNTLPIVSHQIPALVVSKGIVENDIIGEFPIHRVYCVGRNYREHALEMGHDPNVESPLFFQKPSDAITTKMSISYPPMTDNLHYEGELVVAISKGGHKISLDDAMTHVCGYALACDLTRRDLQAEAKRKGRPWEAAKAFDDSAPCSPLVLFSENQSLKNNYRLITKVNGSIKQQATLGEMIWSIPQIIFHLSQYYQLQPGDLILTGTPAGVSSLEIGDNVEISLCDEDESDHLHHIIPSCNFNLLTPT